MSIECLGYSSDDDYRKECCKLNMMYTLPRCRDKCFLEGLPYGAHDAKAVKETSATELSEIRETDALPPLKTAEGKVG